MNSREEIRRDIRDLVDPGSMDPSTIVDALCEEHSKREVQVEVVNMIAEGDLQEHSDFDDVNTVPD